MKKVHQKMDPKLVAADEKLQNEVRSIASRFKIPIAVVRATMKEQGKNGKPSRSRAKIYAALRVKGYTIDLKGRNHGSKKAARAL